MSDLSGLNPTPHAIAVYASRPLSPGVTQHSLPSGRCPLLGPVFHRLDRTSLPGALIRSPRRRRRAPSADGRQLSRLLRARRERLRDRRAAEQSDEVAPLQLRVHSITSSASCWRCKGTSRPSALAVLRLIASSNLVGCITGKSATLAPLRIRSTYEAAR